MIRLLILGPTGSMGRLITELALKDDKIDVVAACDVKDIGKTLQSIVATEDRNKIVLEDISNLADIIKRTTPEVAVDFTTAKATEINCLTCVQNGVKCVIGTTALSQEFLMEFKKAVKVNSAPTVISPNMASGMNVFFKIVQQLSHYLNEWDIEIIEA
ncbi:MAG: hypothetical protein P8Y23_10945, partial [Candidatus Lokiarchaeota archaeon]